MPNHDIIHSERKEYPVIEALPDFPENVIAFACRGHVRRRDYETVLIPTVEKQVKRHQKVRLYYQIGDDFAGIDPGAIWEDFKVGVEHITRWKRIAVVTDIKWISDTMSVFSFLVPGEMKIFPTAEMSKARMWIAAR